MPPPGAGFVTVTVTCPAVVSSDAGILTTSDVPLCDEIATGVSPKVTVDAGMKFVPVIVNEVVGDPAGRLDGERLLAVGAGLVGGVTVNPTALEATPPGLITLTGTGPDSDIGMAKNAVIVLLSTSVPPTLIPL